MKTILTAAVIAALVAVGVVLMLKPNAQNGEVAAKESAYARVMRTGVLRCGYLVWPPLMNKDPNTGELSGILHDYMKALAKEAELEVEFTQEVSLETYLQDMNNGRYDVECAGGWPNAVRGKLAAYVDPIAYYPMYAYVRADDNRFDDKPLNVFNDEAVRMVVTDGETSDILHRKRFPNSARVSLPVTAVTADMMLLNVATGKGDVVFLDVATGQQYIAKNPNTVKQLPTPVRVVEINLSVANGEDKLLNFLNKATDQLQLDGTLESILTQYENGQTLFLRPAKPYQHTQTKN